jgi:hypothetical protein
VVEVEVVVDDVDDVDDVEVDDVEVDVVVIGGVLTPPNAPVPLGVPRPVGPS